MSFYCTLKIEVKAEKLPLMIRKPYRNINQQLGVFTKMYIQRHGKWRPLNVMLLDSDDIYLDHCEIYTTRI